MSLCPECCDLKYYAHDILARHRWGAGNQSTHDYVAWYYSWPRQGTWMLQFWSSVLNRVGWFILPLTARWDFTTLYKPHWLFSSYSLTVIESHGTGMQVYINWAFSDDLNNLYTLFRPRNQDQGNILAMKLQIHHRAFSLLLYLCKLLPIPFYARD